MNVPATIQARTRPPPPARPPPPPPPTPQARTTNPTLFTDATADLAAALSAGSNGGGLYGQTANGSWPMPIVQYMLTYRNLTGYGYSGPLLRALAE